LYWLMLSTTFEFMQSCVNLGKDSLKQYQNNKQKEYIYNRDQIRQDEKAKRRTSRFNIWRRTTKSIVNNAVDIRDQIKRPFSRRNNKKNNSDSKPSFKSIDRGGYIPPFPNLLLLNPQTYIGLTDFQIQTMLFTHDPVHLIIRRQEILDEVQEMLEEIKNFSQKIESKVNRIEKIQSIKFKTKWGIISTYFYLVSLIAATSEIGTVTTTSAPLPAPVPIMVVQPNSKVRVNNLFIQSNQTILTQNENIPRIRIKRRTKFNRKVHTLSDLPTYFHKNHSDIETTEERSLQSMKVPKIKIN